MSEAKEARSWVGITLAGIALVFVFLCTLAFGSFMIAMLLPELWPTGGPAEVASVAERDNRMLSAQESMARTGALMVVCAALSVVVTALGTVFLLKQLQHTRAALYHAGDANRIAREGQRKQLRAYVSIEPFLHGGQVSIRFANSGSTPALNFSGFIKGQYIADGNKEPLSWSASHHMPIAAGDFADVDLELGEESANLFYASSLDIYLDAECCYQDIFDEEHQTKASFLSSNGKAFASHGTGTTFT